MTQSVTSKTLRGPNACTSQPFKIVPIMEPQPSELLVYSTHEDGVSDSYLSLGQDQFARRQSRSSLLGLASRRRHSRRT